MAPAAFPAAMSGRIRRQITRDRLHWKGDLVIAKTRKKRRSTLRALVVPNWFAPNSRDGFLEALAKRAATGKPFLLKAVESLHGNQRAILKATIRGRLAFFGLDPDNYVVSIVPLGATLSITLKRKTIPRPVIPAKWNRQRRNFEKVQ